MKLKGNNSINKGTLFVKKGNLEDEGLIQGIRNKTDEAFHYVYTNFKQEVIRKIIHNGGCLDDAEDVFHDGLIELTLKCGDKKVQIENVKSYLIGICWNLWLKKLRDRRRSFEDVIEDEFSIQKEEDNRDEMYRLYLHYLEKLPDSCRQIIVLAGKGYSIKEIAEELSMTQGYVRKRKSDCLSNVKKTIKKDPRYEQLND